MLISCQAVRTCLSFDRVTFFAATAPRSDSVTTRDRRRLTTGLERSGWISTRGLKEVHGTLLLYPPQSERFLIRARCTDRGCWSPSRQHHPHGHKEVTGRLKDVLAQIVYKRITRTTDSTTESRKRTRTWHFSILVPLASSRFAGTELKNTADSRAMETMAGYHEPTFLDLICLLQILHGVFFASSILMPG